MRIRMGNLRPGLGDATVLDALATARWKDAKKRKLLEGAYNKTSDLGLIARSLWEHPGEEEAQRAVAGLAVQVGKPIHSQLAERLPTAEAIIAKMGVVVAQYKYDGFRTQIHKGGQQVPPSRAIWKTHRTCSQKSLREPSSRYRQSVPYWTLRPWPTYNATSEEFSPFQETTRRRLLSLRLLAVPALVHFSGPTLTGPFGGWPQRLLARMVVLLFPRRSAPARQWLL